MKPDFSSLAAKWPSTIVARQELGHFSGGILEPKTIANRDALGIGIPGKMSVGRKVCYPVSSVIAYLEDRAK